MSTATIVTQTHRNSNALAKVAGVPACERDPQYAADAVREFAERQGWTFAEIASFARGVAQQTPWLAAIAAAADSMAGAVRMVNAEVRAHSPSTGVQVSGSQPSPATYHYKFAPSSHRSKHVRFCKDCAKLGRKCWRHGGKAVAK